MSFNLFGSKIFFTNSLLYLRVFLIKLSFLSILMILSNFWFAFLFKFQTFLCIALLFHVTKQKVQLRQSRRFWKPRLMLMSKVAVVPKLTVVWLEISLAVNLIPHGVVYDMFVLAVSVLAQVLLIKHTDVVVFAFGSLFALWV